MTNEEWFAIYLKAEQTPPPKKDSKKCMCVDSDGNVEYINEDELEPR